jgi:hypothetical protein
MSRGQSDLAVTGAVAIVTCAAALGGAPVAVTAVLGILLFAALGYVLGQLLLGPEAAGLERMIVSTALALCVPIFGGLALYFTGIPLHRTAWVALLAGVTVAGDGLVLWRRRLGHTVHFRWRWDRQVPRRSLLTFGAAVVVGVCAVGLAHAGAVKQHYPGFTELWLAPRGHNDAVADLGVSNHQGSPGRYRLVLRRDGARSNAWDLSLANGQTWHHPVPLTQTGTTSADLYRWPDLSHPYRHVAVDGQGTVGS